MNRILSILLLCFVSFAVGARTYSVDEIPNVHLADSTRYVSKIGRASCRERVCLSV